MQLRLFGFCYIGIYQNSQMTQTYEEVPFNALIAFLKITINSYLSSQRVQFSTLVKQR